MAASWVSASGTRRSNTSRTRSTWSAGWRSATASAPALYGIEVLNEPRWDVPTQLLEQYYRRAYDAIRVHCPPDRVAVVFHDGFRPHSEFLPFFRAGNLENVIFDVHRYQCFERADLDMDVQGHLHKAGVTWRDEADTIQRELGVPAIAGEWSLGLDLKVVSLWADGPFHHALQPLDAFQEAVALRGYAAAQLLAFEHYLGWFFWSYRTIPRPPGASASAWSAAGCRRAIVIVVAVAPAAIEQVLRLDHLRQHQFAVVQGLEAGMEAHRHQRGIGQFAVEHFEDQPLPVRVERVGRLFHEHPRGPVQQHAGEAEPLLRTQRQ